MTMGFLDFFRAQEGESIPTGSDVSAGTYRCTECGNEIKTGSVQSLPPCPECNNNSWDAVTGGDAAADPGR
jgi:Zn finger protein HypA/HybF involved in hydrogenase expression